MSGAFEDVRLEQLCEVVDPRVGRKLFGVSGVAITTAAVDLIRRSGLRPARTIRLIHWGAEEVGLFGARAYADRHAKAIDDHVIGSESDFGADRVYRVDAHVSPEGMQVVDDMLRLHLRYCP